MKKWLNYLQPTRIANRLSLEIRCLYNRIFRGYRISAAPAFIVGCGHSGTSLLLAILGAHSNIYAIPYEANLFQKNQRQLSYLLRLFDRTALAAGKTRWIEKTPRNITVMQKLLDVDEGAKIVVIIRDGRDVACSIQDREGDIKAGITRWVEHNNLADSFRNHPRVYFLKYEDLIRDFKSTIEPVLSFLGEQYEESVERYYEKPTKWFRTEKIEKPDSVQGSEDHRQYRSWQVNQKLFDGRNKWKNKISEAEKSTIKKIAGQKLIDYGYADDLRW